MRPSAGSAGLGVHRADLVEARPSSPKRELLYKEEVALRNQFGAELAGQVEIRREAAGLQEMLGDANVALGDNRAGRDHHDRALALREEIAQDNPNLTQAQRDLLLSYKKIGNFRLLEGKDPAGARSLYEKALAEFDRRLRDEPENVVGEARPGHHSLLRRDGRSPDGRPQGRLGALQGVPGDPRGAGGRSQGQAQHHRPDDCPRRCGQHQIASNTAQELIT